MARLNPHFPYTLCCTVCKRCIPLTRHEAQSAETLDKIKRSFASHHRHPDAESMDVYWQRAMMELAPATVH